MRAVLFLLLMAPAFAWAAPFDIFLMPGELIEGHKKYEKQCEKCHEPFDKQEQNQLCLDCHKKVKQDVVNKKGYHGKSEQVKDKRCKFCHTDHIGRNAKIVELDEHAFDHRQTDFKLKGAHQKINCSQCHVKDKKFREAKHECIACHKKDDVHKRRMGNKCQDCHSEKSWKKAEFDHDETDFKLKGKHKKVLCADCHPNQRYKRTPTQCVDCHKVQDVHLGDMGKKCYKCHSSEKWKKILFNHDKETKFKLRFRHAKLSCSSCHKKNAYKFKLKKKCFSCHEADDKHNKLYGKKCADCHKEKSWDEVKFDHDIDTDYKLIGVHKDIECNNCHFGDLYKDKVNTQCQGCHVIDDVHNGKQGKKCDTCHNPSGWLKKMSFDHDLTNFPLIGLHGITACERCHISTEYKLKNHSCYACHEIDDTHKLKLTSLCETCHNPNDWQIWVFSHNDQTDYKLDGAHKNLKCEACHQEPIEKEEEIVLSDNCEACHAIDDVHSGQFGKFCDKCHTTESFKDITIGIH